MAPAAEGQRRKVHLGKGLPSVMYSGQGEYLVISEVRGLRRGAWSRRWSRVVALAVASGAVAGVAAFELEVDVHVGLEEGGGGLAGRTGGGRRRLAG